MHSREAGLAKLIRQCRRVNYIGQLQNYRLARKIQFVSANYVRLYIKKQKNVLLNLENQNIVFFACTYIRKNLSLSRNRNSQGL